MTQSSDQQFILERVERVASGCWEWKRARNSYGYGTTWRAGRQQGAHRVAYEVFVGPIPKGMLVCHHCDNPACVNPEHLFLGTPAQNSGDMREKGRSVRGEGRHNAKLTEELVLQIRGASGSQRSIAARFGVSQSRVSLIKNQKTWAHVEEV